MSAVRLLIADDHVFYREGVKSMLGAAGSGVAVVGEAGTGEDAIRLVGSLRPDVVLMDLKMPGLSAHPATAVLVLTMFDDESVFAAIRAGARGYLLKDATVEELRRAVEAVHRGEAIFSPSVATRLLRYVAAGTGPRPAGPFPDLTDRERDILRLLTQGCTNAEVADRLGLTTKTVRNYVSNVLTKLQVSDRAQAVVKARDAGFPPT